jgi:hypothetical protein
VLLLFIVSGKLINQFSIRREVRTIPYIQRNAELHRIVERLRVEAPTFCGSTVDHWEATDYMGDEPIKVLLRDYAEGLRKLQSVRGCGELTKGEKKILKILIEEGY